MFKEHYVKPVEEAACECRKISAIVAHLKFSDKKERHSRNTQDHGEKVAEMEFLSNNKRRKDEYVDRCRVLKEDRVGTCRIFGRPNEQKEQECIRDRCESTDGRQFQSAFVCEQQNREAGQKGSKER